MWVAIFIGMTIICAIGWGNRYIACMALTYYIAKNQYKLPDEEDLEECTDYVIKRLFKIDPTQL